MHCTLNEVFKGYIIKYGTYFRSITPVNQFHKTHFSSVNAYEQLSFNKQS